MKRYKVGYTQGVYDMFHVGHLNLLKNSKRLCEYLIVGINSDELVEEYKNKKTVVSEINRCEIVSSIRCVDKCVIMDTLDKIEAWKRFKFDAVFIGDDWKGNERWHQTEIDLRQYCADVVYIPYTKDISSTSLRGKYNNRIDEKLGII